MDKIKRMQAYEQAVEDLRNFKAFLHMFLAHRY
jgi:hypothetical protein